MVLEVIEVLLDSRDILVIWVSRDILDSRVIPVEDIVGFTGLQGHTGYGQKGEPNGPAGPAGSQGFTGYQGSVGFQGFTGFQGLQGEGLAYDSTVDLVCKDLSANDASFNNVDITSLKVNGSNVTGDLDGISETTYSRYDPVVGESVTWSGPTTENAIQFSKHIIPSQNDTYDIGGTGGSRWNALHVKEIFVSGDSILAGPVKAISIGGDGNLAMPSGAKIGGINPGTIVIKGKKESSANLPEQGLTGDGYIVGGDLYVAADNNNPTTWTNVGTIRGPQGPRGYQGFTGFQS